MYGMCITIEKISRAIRKKKEILQTALADMLSEQEIAKEYGKSSFQKIMPDLFQEPCSKGS